MPKYYHTPYGWREIQEVGQRTPSTLNPKINWLCGNSQDSCYVTARTRQDADKLAKARGMEVLGLSKILN